MKYWISEAEWRFFLLRSYNISSVCPGSELDECFINWMFGTIVEGKCSQPSEPALHSIYVASSPSVFFQKVVLR